MTANKQTSPSLSTGEYIEPENFKGSKGEWYVEFEKGLFPSVILGVEKRAKGHKPYIVVNDTDSRLDGTHEATAMLISQAKEMAKCLQKIIKLKDASMSTQDLFHVLKAIDEAKPILQKAIPQ